jgi:TolA-binding protein
MDINTVLRGIESKLPSKVARPGLAESGDVKTSADDLAALLRRVSESSTREVEELISQLQDLRRQLQNAGDRIQRDIAQYTELSQQTMQLTAIISDSVKKLPTGASSLLH